MSRSAAGVAGVPLVRALLAGILPTLALLACSGPSADASRAVDPFPRGLVTAGSDVVCAPSHAWKADAAGVWSFRGAAEVACAVLRPPRGAVELAFVPAADSLGFRFDLDWDGRRLPLEATGGRTDGTLRVLLDRGRLAVGSHVLRLTRRPERDDNDRPENRFRALSMALPGSARAPFPAAAAERYAYLADLLVTGVTGLGPMHLAGFLFAGPGEHVLELPAAPSLHLRPENLSAAPARFTVEVKGAAPGAAAVTAEVAPRRRGDLAIALPPRRRGERLRVTFRVEGEPAGLYLWGAPRLAWTPVEAAAPPPVVLVTLDTTRRDALGAYGGTAGVTPVLDDFAARATVYDRAVSTAPWTLPAHVSMLTGLYPGHHGTGVSHRQLPRALPTLPEMLRRHGYHTAGFAGGRLMDHDFAVSRGFDVYADPEVFETRGDRLSERVLAELERAAPGPRFLLINYFDAHAAYDAPPEFQRRTGVEAARRALGPPGEPAEWRRIAAGDRQAWQGALDGTVTITPAARRWLRAAYEAEVAFVDHQLGVVFAALRRHGLFEPAWIVVVADHGELLGEDGHLSHGYRLDPELVDVPLLVKRPGQRRGERSSALVSVADLFPTLLAAAGVAPPTGLDGRPLGAAGGRARVYFEEHRGRVHLLPNRHLWLGRDVYGVESLAARRVLWDGGQQCARRAANGAANEAASEAGSEAGSEGADARLGWLAVPCGEGDTATALRALHRSLGRPASGEYSADALSDEDRAALAALGYL